MLFSPPSSPFLRQQTYRVCSLLGPCCHANDMRLVMLGCSRVCHHHGVLRSRYHLAHDAHTRLVDNQSRVQIGSKVAAPNPRAVIARNPWWVLGASDDARTYVQMVRLSCHTGRAP
ncbi:unnamed protein product [Ectocarpus sp. 13 AM-2016]